MLHQRPGAGGFAGIMTESDHGDSGFQCGVVHDMFHLAGDKQIALDKEYISSRGVWKDFLILLKTIPAILTGKGAW